MSRTDDRFQASQTARACLRCLGLGVVADTDRSRLRYARRSIGRWRASSARPVDGLEAFPSLSKDEEAARKQPRYPFDDDQLNRLYSSAWYDPCESRRFTGKMRTDLGARYWVPLIGLFHGNRVREAVQLVASDFWLDGEMLVLGYRTEIENDGEEGTKRRTKGRPKRSTKPTTAPTAASVEGLRSLKNDATRRVVPVHPVLVELGLSDYRLVLPGALGQSSRCRRQVLVLLGGPSRRLRTPSGMQPRRFSRNTGSPATKSVGLSTISPSSNLNCSEPTSPPGNATDSPRGRA